MDLVDDYPGWMHGKQSNNSHQTRFIREGTMMHAPDISNRTGAHTFLVAHGTACTFYSDAARHSWHQNPETKPDLISVTQYIESRSVNVINHAALYELTS